MARRAGVPAAAVTLGLLAGGPAFADVTVSPASAAQGTGENLTLHVTNTGTAPITTITVRLPADTPVAEVYPLSVPDWAPRIVPRTLSTPLDTMHGGTPVTQTAAAITWIAVPGRGLAPGRGTDVAMAVGPLPTVSAMRLTVETAYADGRPGPAMPPATLALTPAPAGQAADHHGGGGTAAADGSGDVTAAEEQVFADAVAEAGRGPSVWSIGGWVLAGLLLLGGAATALRGRHRRVEDDDEPDDDESGGTPPQEPVAAGSGKWAYRD